MDFIFETKVGFDEVSNLLPEATSTFERLSSIFEGTELEQVIKNMASDSPALAVALGSLYESMPLVEFMTKHVNSKGEMTRRKDLKTRQRQAFQTTGLSKSERRRIARKAAKTKRANPNNQIRAKKKAKKAREKRKSMYGLS